MNKTTLFTVHAYIDRENVYIAEIDYGPIETIEATSMRELKDRIAEYIKGDI